MNLPFKSYSRSRKTVYPDFIRKPTILGDKKWNLQFNKLGLLIDDFSGSS